MGSALFIVPASCFLDNNSIKRSFIYIFDICKTLPRAQHCYALPKCLVLLNEPDYGFCLGYAVISLNQQHVSLGSIVPVLHTGSLRLNAFCQRAFKRRILSNAHAESFFYHLKSHSSGSQELRLIRAYIQYCGFESYLAVSAVNYGIHTSRKILNTMCCRRCAGSSRDIGTRGCYISTGVPDYLHRYRMNRKSYCYGIKSSRGGFGYDICLPEYHSQWSGPKGCSHFLSLRAYIYCNCLKLLHA